jgi:predicted AlkP superfamily pyrophosphatase or phosphodiesterase
VNKTLVINAVGMTRSLLGPHTPRLNQLIASGKITHLLEQSPGLTCSAQATYLTGKTPTDHGIVGNGWYFKDTSEIRFWHQSAHLVQSPTLIDIARARDASFTAAHVCWWYAMYASADYILTPRPMYPADGRKLPDCWTQPAALRDSLQQSLGQFPLFKFWGPMTSIESTDWIARAAIDIDRQHNPTLSLVYLPHLDYNLQRLGPADPRIKVDVAELDAVIGKLIDHFSARGARIIVLSEYGIVPVSRPVHVNRVLRKLGLIQTRVELGRELLDAGASRAFAVADHQIAHVYVNQPDDLPRVIEALRSTAGVAKVYARQERREIHLDHPRAGDVVVLAEPDAWFTYYYWDLDSLAPDFARTVDIHRKPGYDPCELFLDPAISNPKLKIGATLLKRKLGMRSLLDVIPLDATLVKGSHGLPATSTDLAPILISSQANLTPDSPAATGVAELILGHVF